MIRASRMMSTLALAAAAIVASASSSDAAFSTINFGEDGIASVNGADLITSTTFNIGNLRVSGGTATNLFLGTNSANFGALSINVLPGQLKFSFGNSSFGTFTGTSATVFGPAVASPGTESLGIYILGSFKAGTDNVGNLGSPAAPASFTITYGQSGTTYNDSAILSIPPAVAPVPEPASAVLMGLGLAGIGAVALRRRAGK